MKHQIARSIVGGLAGTAVMTMVMYLVAPMMGVHMDMAQMLGSMLGGNWAAGLMMHVINGAVIFAVIYSYFVYERLPGTPVIRGATWGVILWAPAQVVVMPMMGAGFFSVAMGGMMAAVGSLVAHLLYGGILGAIAGAPEHVVVRGAV